MQNFERCDNNFGFKCTCNYIVQWLLDCIIFLGFVLCFLVIIFLRKYTWHSGTLDHTKSCKKDPTQGYSFSLPGLNPGRDPLNKQTNKQNLVVQAQD